MIVDTHAHLADEDFTDLEPFLTLVSQAGVHAILSVGTTTQDSLRCIELAELHPQLRASVGIHPNHCCRATECDWNRVLELCRHPRVAALGETGLDRYWDDCPWDIQVDYFRRHLALGRETQLPCVIHTRECGAETLQLLQAEARLGPIRGVMHSFTGTAEVAQGCLDLGLYISFAGMVTYKNAEQLRAVAKLVPDDRILVETDSPYLTPHPHRGKRPNHPAMVVHTLRCLAAQRDRSLEELASITTGNAYQLFGPW